METVKIAPDLSEITRKGNVFACKFNGMRFRWCIAEDCSCMNTEKENRLKQCLQAAIAMSDKCWQVRSALNQSLPFASKLYVDDKEV